MKYFLFKWILYLQDNLELQTKTPNSNLNSLSSTINSNGIPFTPCTDETNLPLNSHSISTNSINCGNQNNIKNIQVNIFDKIQ